jgi:serine/threonine protein kinase
VDVCGVNQDLTIFFRRLRYTLDHNTEVHGESAPNPTSLMNIGPYRDLQEIGRGGMGVVYKARDSRNGRTVAIKRIQGLASRSQQARLALMREAGMTAQLRHKNIVTVLDVGQQQGTLFIVMEYLDGHTLNQLMKLGKALGFSQRVDIIKQVCVALQYAHERGVIHRDIKPANVFVLQDLPAKVLDFGISALSETQSASPIGTPFYMSPEQIQGSEIGPRSDIWSAGVTLFELVRGRMPFVAGNMSVLFSQILNAELPPTPQSFPFAEQFDRIFSRSMAKKPENRYASSLAFAQDLEKLIPCIKQCEEDNPEHIWQDHGDLSDRTLDTIDEIEPLVLAPEPERPVKSAGSEHSKPGQDVGPSKVSDERQADVGYKPPNLGFQVASLRNVRLVQTVNVTNYITLVGIPLTCSVGFLTYYIWVLYAASTITFLAYYVSLLCGLLFGFGCQRLANWWTQNPRCPGCRLPMPRRSEWLNYPRSQIEDSFVRTDCIGALQSGAWPEATKLFTILGQIYQGNLNINRRYRLSFHECVRCQRHAARFAIYALRIKRNNGDDFWVQKSPAIVAHAGQPDEGKKVA